MPYNMGDAIGYIKLNIQDFKNKYEQVHSDTENLDKIADGMGSIFDKAGKMIVAAFASIAAASAAALKSVISVGSSFQSSMSQVAATMGMSANEIANNSEEYKKLSEAAKEMGATTKFSATEAADALNYLALAGYSVNDSVSMLPKILDVAAAGGMDLAKASDMVTDAMSALGLSLDEADSFIDKLARTSQKSNTSVSQLGEAILQIGGTAKSLAGGVSELDTALGILANNGIKASEGGIALRQVILNLTAPSEKAAGFMEEIGLKAYDAYGNMKPLNQIFSELNDILSEYNTQQAKDNVLTSIFDARQLKSARALLSGYGEAWDDLYENIENAEGAAHRMAETMQENLTGAITIAKSALEGVQVTAFEALEKNLTKSVKVATSSIDELNKTLQTPEMQKALEKIGSMLGDILSKFVEFVANKAIPQMIKWFSELDEIVEKLKSVFAGLSVTLPIISAGVILCNTSVQAYIGKVIAAKVATFEFNAALLANPFTIVAVALGALVASVVNYVQESKKAYASVLEQNTIFIEQAEAAKKNKEALDDLRQSSNAMVNEVTEQINEIRTLCNQLGEYANKTNLSTNELTDAQNIIEKLNELYPENTAYIEDGQVKAYDELAKSLQDYTDKLYYAQKLEAERNKYFGAKDVIEESNKQLEENKQLLIEAEEELGYWLKKREQYDKFGGQYTGAYADQLKAQAEGFERLGNYIDAHYEAAQESYRNIALAMQDNVVAQKEAENEIKQSQTNIIKYTLASGKEIEGIYADEASATKGVAQQQANEIEAINREAHKEEIEAAEKAAQEKIDAYSKMWEDIDQLDKDWQLRRISSEEEYQEKRKAFLEQGMDIGVDDDKWIKEYNKSLVYQEKVTKEAEAEKTKIEKEAADERQKIRKEEIDSQIKDLEARVETDVNYTKEMMIKDKEAIIDGLDKNSDLYKEYSKEIIEDKRQLKIDLAKENQQIAENDFKTWQDSYNNLVNEATDAYNQIKTNQDNLVKSLTSGIKLYDTESTKVWDKSKRAYKTEDSIKVNAKAMEEQAAATEDYIKALEDLQGTIPDSLMAEIYAMDREEGAKYVAELSKMSDTELKAYSEAYQKQYDMAKEFSEKMYDEQLQSFKQNYADKFENIFKEVPENMNLVGKDSIDGFIKGVEDNTKNAEGAMKELADNVLTKTKEVLGIHSPSKEFEEIGINSILGFIKGIISRWQEILDGFKTLGENSGNKFVEGFKSVWSVFADSLKNDISSLATLNDISMSFDKPNINSFQSQNQSGIQQYPQFVQYPENSYKNETLSKQDIISAIKEAVPDGDIILQVDGRAFGIIARKELNMIAGESGNLNIKN